MMGGNISRRLNGTSYFFLTGTFSLVNSALALLCSKYPGDKEDATKVSPSLFSLMINYQPVHLSKNAQFIFRPHYDEHCH